MQVINPPHLDRGNSPQSAGDDSPSRVIPQEIEETSYLDPHAFMENEFDWQKVNSADIYHHLNNTGRGCYELGQDVTHVRMTVRTCEPWSFAFSGRC